MAKILPLVSIIIATYNRPAFLKSAISSVLCGEYQNVEIIVTDDSGSEESCETVLALHDVRVRYRRNPARLGGALNHREGLRLATGRYVGLLNDDDEWEPTFLERLVPILDRNPEIVIAFSDHWVMNAAGEIDPKATDECTRRFKRDALSEGLHRPFHRIALINQSVPLVAALLRRDAIDWGDNAAEIGSLYDFWVTYLAVRTGMAAYYIPERLARYRVHGANETSIGGEQVVKPALYIYSRMLADPNLAELRPHLRARLRQAHLNYGTFLLKNGNMAQSRRQLWNALPNARAAGALALSFAPGRIRSSLMRD